MRETLVVTVDTGDGYYSHGKSWFASLTAAEKRSLSVELANLKDAGAITSFGIKPLSTTNGLPALLPEIRTWIKANPTGRAYGGPGSR